MIVLVERVFRGQKSPILVQMDGATYKPDFILVPKDQEAKYINATEAPQLRIMPRTTNFPPLLEEMLIQESQEEGKDVSNIKLELVYSPLGIKSYRIAEEGETPTTEIKIGLGQPESPSLYENIKQENAS